MKRMNVQETKAVEGGYMRCAVCHQNVYGGFAKEYAHCVKHASRCLPWRTIFRMAMHI